MEPVAPQKRSANCWVRVSMCCICSGVNTNLPKMVNCKIKGLFNKLTMEHFNNLRKIGSMDALDAV